MKRFIYLYFLLTITASVSAQVDISYGMTSNENLAWLTTLKNTNKKSQLDLVKDRLVEKRQPLSPSDKLDVPVLIIDGIPIADNISEQEQVFLITQLTPETVDIKIIEKEPDELYINKAFSGIVLITITDKKVSRKFRKL